MPSPPLVLPGVLFVGEDERARVVAHVGPAAGWFVPRGINDWSTEVSVVPRDALSEDIKKSTKLVMPEEQIAPAKMPLTREAALKSPLVAVSSKLTSKLVEAGIRVHTVGVDRVTSSFYYLAEGGTEEPVSVSGDLVQSVALMLGDRADNAAIERVLDGLADRLVRALSNNRLTELSVELAALLPRAAADGSGAADLDLEGFEKSLGQLLGSSEKFRTQAKQIADDLVGTYERKLAVPLFGEARKSSMGPFDLMVGDKKVPLPTYERWIMSGPLEHDEKAAAAASAQQVPSTPPAKPAPRPGSSPAITTPPAKSDAEKKAEADKKAAAEKAEAEKKAAAAKAAADKAAAEKAAAEKAAAEKAAAEKAAAEKKAAEEKAAAEKAAAEKAEAEKKAAAEKAEADKKAAEKAEADKRAAEEKAAADKKAEKAEKKADKAEKKAEKSEKKADKAEKESKASDEKKDLPQSKITTQKIVRKEDKSSSTMYVIALVLVAAAVYLGWRIWFQHR
jgi:hypothetical protein